MALHGDPHEGHTCLRASVGPVTSSCGGLQQLGFTASPTCPCVAVCELPLSPRQCEVRRRQLVMGGERGSRGMVGSYVDIGAVVETNPCDRELPVTRVARSACSHLLRPVRLARPVPRALALQRLAVCPRELPRWCLVQAGADSSCRMPFRPRWARQRCTDRYHRPRREWAAVPRVGRALGWRARRARPARSAIAVPTTELVSACRGESIDT